MFKVSSVAHEYRVCGHHIHDSCELNSGDYSGQGAQVLYRLRNRNRHSDNQGKRQDKIS
jgi:hypothetical protein